MCLQAYLVYRYSGKEQPQTTISRGSKYMAAPKTATMLSTVTSRDASSTHDKMAEDGDCTSTLEKDIQVPVAMCQIDVLSARGNHFI